MRYLEGGLQFQGEHVVVKGNEIQGELPQAHIRGDASFLEQFLANTALVWQKVDGELQVFATPASIPWCLIHRPALPILKQTRQF